MMKSFIPLLLFSWVTLTSVPVFSQKEPPASSDTTLLGLPGDGLDLYAVLTLFQKSKTIEDFEKSLNTKETGINNLDLNLDNKVDFIKVITKQEKNDFTFILRVDVSEKEKQDVAVILLSKDDKGKVIMQIVGDKELYGKNYVIEPKTPATPNPGYTGSEPKASASTANPSSPSTTTVVVVESAPVVQYVYSPVYVPYVPPPLPPPYFVAFTVMAVSAYHYNTYHYNAPYHGGCYSHTTVNVYNQNNYNNYSTNTRNTSNTVNHNNSSGSYKGNGGSRQPATTPATGQQKGKSASTQPSTSQSKGNSPSTQPSDGPSKNKSSSAKPTTNQSKGSAPRSGQRRSGGGGKRR
jgi:hypothetical protein